MHREFIAVHIIWDYCHLIPVVGVIFVRGEQALLVPAMRAAHQHGFMPEAYGGAERVALTGREALSAVFADIFFFGGVLRGYHRGNTKPEKKQGDTYYRNCYCKRAHIYLLVDDVFYRYSFLWKKR